MHHLLKDFLKVTEEAAVKTIPWVGSGDKNSADDAATTSMRENLNQIEMNSIIAIGEGELDEAPMLYINEEVGTGLGVELDIAVDPIDGTTPTAAGEDNGITVIAAAPKGTLLHAPDMYMEKLVVGPEAVGKINIDAPLMENVRAVALAKGKQVDELQVVVQERPRHEEAIAKMREAGVTVHLFKDGDVLQSLRPCIHGNDIDMFYNIGGAPEGVLSSVAIKSLGGEMQGRLVVRNQEEKKRCVAMGVKNPTAALRHHDLIASEQGMFIATAITNTLYLKGIQEDSTHYQTESLVVSSLTNDYQIVKSNHRVLEYV
ncbi:class II fructose-bisphosphatase [Ornithinibacillus halophilus]|uniref:Fructose-1,6-bisphosphatase n=2 Tax=Ornithinibacillus halophilus TaxID=930117 RepID=A0A1M5NIM7_9BACI|nr:class II fructose-bisphosphatase [Ornithinibacillus halophilus]SHG89069.1 fructose-1,6-bisphosphatase II [Ornithinibacillus halophilus]